MKKAIALILTATMLTVAMAVMAGATEGATDPWQGMPYYLSVTGTVEAVEDYDGQDGWYRISIQDADDSPTTMIITDRTVFPFENEVEEGDVVTGFYLTNAPIPMIWPPQYNIAVLVAGMPDDLNINADRFYTWEDNDDGYMLGKGESFAFLIDEDTEIILANGDDFSDGEIEGRRMVVIYGPSTRSIPELATAIKIIVLYEDIMALPDAAPVTGLDYVVDATGWPIHVDGTLISAPAVFQTDEGTVMIPLRAVAEALGFEVIWEAATFSVVLDDTIRLSINSETYSNGDAVIELAVAPALVNAFTYVPIYFFTEVLELPFAFATEGKIEING